MFKKILFPIETPEDFKHLLLHTDLIKRLGGEQVHLVNIVVTEEQITAAIGMLERLSSSAIVDFALSYEVSIGHVASEIARIGREKSLDLIYVRSKRNGRFRKMLLGNTAADIVRLADTPTLVDKSIPHFGPIKSILYATDFKVGAHQALTYVKKLASPTSVLWVQYVGMRAGDPTSEKQRMDKAENNLQQLALELGQYSSVITINSLGRPGVQIKKTVVQNNIDLLILGRGTQSGMKRIIGSTARKLVSEVDCFILMIP